MLLGTNLLDPACQGHLPLFWPLVLRHGGHPRRHGCDGLTRPNVLEQLNFRRLIRSGVGPGSFKLVSPQR